MEAVRQPSAAKKEVTMGDIPAAIRQQLDQLVDMQGEVFGRLSRVELAIAPNEQAGKNRTETIPQTPQDESPPQQTPGEGLTDAELSETYGIPPRTVARWKSKIQQGESLSTAKNPIASHLFLGDDKLWYLRE